MSLKHIKSSQYSNWRQHLYKKNLDHLILYCSFIALFLTANMLLFPISKTMITLSTILLITYFICIVGGIYIQKRKKTKTHMIMFMCLTFFLSTIAWLIVTALHTEDIIQYYYYFIIIFMALSAFIVIFPVVHMIIAMSLCTIGLFSIQNMALADIYYSHLIIALGVFSIVSNYFRYESAFQHFNLKRQLDQNKDFLSDITDKDHLTNLYNNEFMFQRINEAISMYKRYHSPFAIMFVDIDDFRGINTAYGQVFGDDIITIVGNILLTTCRDTDFIGRYSGKRYLVLLQNTNLEESILVAERVRITCQNNHFNTKQPVTLSIGLRAYDGSDFKSFLSATELLLREAKSTGKNNVRY